MDVKQEFERLSHCASGDLIRPAHNELYQRYCQLNDPLERVVSSAA